MTTIDNSWVLITGASSGFGKASLTDCLSQTDSFIQRTGMDTLMPMDFVRKKTSTIFLRNHH
jgi:hypothetical protein